MSSRDSYDHGHSVFGAVFVVCAPPGDAPPGNATARDATARSATASAVAIDLPLLARDFSPRIEIFSEREVLLDLKGLDRLIGDPPTIAAELQRTAAERGLHVRVAIAGTRTAARLLVRAHPGRIVVEPGHDRDALADLPIDLLTVVAKPTNASDANANSANANPANLPSFSHFPNLLTLRRWGLRTLGDLAALPDDEVAARLGQEGVAWQRLARGEDPAPLVPALPEERFEQSLDLEWPVDNLEPLSFVLGRLIEPLSAHLERRGRGAAVLHVRLHLIKTEGATREIHERSLQLPTPIRDARTLRTLALLDLESHPPSAAVDRMEVAVDPTPGRIVQFSLLTRPLPSPERISTLMARLNALMGEGRCGTLKAVDSWRPEAFEMQPFAPRDGSLEVANWNVEHEGSPPPAALRRFRFPVPVRVRFEEGKPARVTTERRGLAGGRIETCAGPWRTSGNWWLSDLWNRDEWDVSVAGGETYRLFHDRESGSWFMDGIVD